MNCKQCGDPMCPETVIKLRRTLFGLRESRFQGAYCAWCKLSVVDPPPAPQARVIRRSVKAAWWRSLLTSLHAGGMAGTDGMPLDHGHHFGEPGPGAVRLT